MVELGANVPTVRKYLAFLFLFIFNQTTFAQQDSIAVIHATWKKAKLEKGVVWKHHHFANSQLFGANQYLSVVEIAAKASKSKLALGYSDSLETTSMIAKRYNAIAGINGSFFKMKGPDPDHQTNAKAMTKAPNHFGNRSIVYLRVADSLITENSFARDSLRRRHQQGIITINKGTLAIQNTTATNLYWERSILAEDILATGPVMLMDGKEQPIPNDAFCKDRHPRTAVGKKPDGTVLLLVVDGRTEQSAGLSIIELQQLMKWLGCTEAINLDGGGSTTMFVNGQPHQGVVNHPSDNKRFDATGERPVANVLLLLPKKKKPK